ncbi:putative secreted lipase [Colletotrichum aenigma]|uniref:putative secreted lipase n=1 Tax=Colletotrichum aenigma TaxID=1215731 RepID=UPI00187232E1|nr:putative secreted lipase [Colletotrichum aenigma]KAF5512700.1 putative secreted lipase [Colletotrichum aenigma]
MKLYNTSPAWLSCLTVALAACNDTENPRVDLGYATYEGTALSNGVNQFLGMRFAAPPVGQNRFKLPQEVIQEHGIVSAKSHGSLCLPVDGLAFTPPPGQDISEDCLFVDVYYPAHVNSTPAQSLPVMVWISGGGFVQLLNENYNGTGLVEASNNGVVIVSFNYRVGPHGFLASEELQKEGSLNIGLHDQRAAMKWVEQHIGKFGGDPNNVTLFATSAGSGSVLLHTLAYGGHLPENDNVKWRAGIAPAVWLPSVHKVEEIQYQYDHLLNATNCSDVACLRSLESDTIQQANRGFPVPGQANIPLFPYGPVIDGHLLTGTPSEMLRNASFAKHRPLILGSSSTEGTIFATQANTTQDVNNFLKTQFPDLTEDDLAQANAQYSYVPSTFPGVNVTKPPRFYQLSQMFGDMAFNCVASGFAAGLSRAGVDVYLLRDHVLDPVEVAAGFIVPHTWELQAVWGPEYAPQSVAVPGANSYDVGGVNHGMVGVVQSYWLSFARTGGNPNAAKAVGAPFWKPYGYGERLKLQTNSTTMEYLHEEELGRCALWSKLSAKTHI